MLNPKILQIIKLSKELVDSKEKDFCGFEGMFSSKYGKQFKIEMTKIKH